MLDILEYFPKQLSNLISKNKLNQIEEIRIRANKPVILRETSSEIILDYIPTQEEILKILQFLCDNSIYSYQNQICNGYITVKRRA